jgi:hypothetical protein
MDVRLREPEQIGKLTVKGSDFLATVCRKGLLLDEVIHTEDEPNAWTKAVQWASENQHRADAK